MDVGGVSGSSEGTSSLCLHSSPLGLVGVQRLGLWERGREGDEEEEEEAVCVGYEWIEWIHLSLVCGAVCYDAGVLVEGEWKGSQAEEGEGTLKHQRRLGRARRGRGEEGE